MINSQLALGELMPIPQQSEQTSSHPRHSPAPAEEDLRHLVL